MTPFVLFAPLTEITGVGVLDNEINQPVATERLGHGPRARFIKVHEGGGDGDLSIQSQRQRLLLRINGGPPAVWVAGVVSLTHATDQRVDTAAIGQTRRGSKKGQIATGHKRRRQTSLGHFNLDVMSHGRLTERAEESNVDHMVIAQFLSPVWKLSFELIPDHHTALKFHSMALAIIEPNRLDPVEVI